VEVVADRPPAIARRPGEQDLAAMRAEALPPELVFATPASVRPVDGLGLVVVDRAQEVEDAAAVTAVRGDVPLLLVVPRADAGQRAALTARFGLRDPLWAGGGWDPAGTRLETATASSGLARRRVLLDLVRSGRPALVVVDSRAQADRTATGLAGAGLRAEVWAPPPLRASRAAAAVASWRSRRLDALVVPAGATPPLGRGRLGLLVDAAGSTPEQWRDRLADLVPQRSVLVMAPDHPLAAVEGCLRAALLEPFGEPVVVPCGCCEGCG
jgi:hypothetical protein